MAYTKPLEPLSSEPPSSSSYLLSYPAKGILIVTINRQNGMNSIPGPAHWEAHHIFEWFDKEPSLRVAIITGAGPKAFCAGQDLIEQNDNAQKSSKSRSLAHPPSGFAGLSRRTGLKPVIAAVNGFALGGGFEICLNCDIVVASPKASFGLPEVTVGIFAAAGGLSRLVRICGIQIASEIAMTGRRLSAEEAKSFHLVNRISATPESLMEEAIRLAKQITAQSPDAIFVTRQGLREALETASVERASQMTNERWMAKLIQSENTKIGLKAFATRSKPNWVASKL